MANRKQTIHVRIDAIKPIATSHRVGEKRVIASKADIGHPYTQIARTILHAGDHVECHVHPTMEEHFFFLNGECEVMIAEKLFSCRGGDYLFIPASQPHAINATKELTMITIGIEYV